MIRNIYVGDSYSRKVTTPLITTDNNSYKITWDTKERGGVFKITAVRDDESSVIDFGELSDNGVATYIIKNEMYAIEGKLTLYLAICDDQAVVTCREIKFTVKKGADENKIAQENVNPINSLAIQVAKSSLDTEAKINNLQSTGIADVYNLQVNEDITVTDGVVTAFLKNDFSEYGAIVFPEGITEIRLPDGGGETPLVANKVIMPKSLKIIGNSSFANIVRFDENDAIIEDSVIVKVKEFVLNEGLETVEPYAFSDNIHLEKINIPESVKVIDMGAFQYADSLKKIIIPATVTKIGDGNFVPTSFNAEDSTIIYGYAGSEAEKYAKNENFTKPFKNKFVNIGSDYQKQINNSSNALKNEVFGEVVNISDISPIKHSIDVKVSSKNLVDLSKWSRKNCEINDDKTLTSYIVDGEYCEISSQSAQLKNTILEHKGKKITFSIAETLADRYMAIVIWYKRADGTDASVESIKKNTNQVSMVIGEDSKGKKVEDFDNLSRIELRFNVKEDTVVHTDTISVVSNIQLEFGEATEYKPYVPNANETTVTVYSADGEAKEYSPDSDGIIEDIMSSYPAITMESSTDGVLIECKYNYDINSKIESIDEVNFKNTESLRIIHQNKLRDVYRAKALGGDVDDDVALQNYIDNETYIYIPQGTYRLKKPLVIRKAGTVLQGEGYGFKTLIAPMHKDVQITVENDGKKKDIKTLIYVKNESGNSMMFTIRDICFKTYTSSGDETIPNENYDGCCIASNQYIIDSKIENCWFNGGGSVIKDGVEDTDKPKISSTAISLNAMHTIISGCWFECFDTAIHLGQETDTKNRNSNGYLITNCDFWCNLNAVEASGRGAIRNCHFSSMQGGFAVRGFNNCLVQVSDCTAWLTRPEVVDKTNDETLLFARNGEGKVVIADDASHLDVRGFSVNETIANSSVYNTVFCANDTAYLEVKDCDLCVGDENEQLSEWKDENKVESVSPNFRFELEFENIPENVKCAIGSKVYFTNPSTYMGAVYTQNGWELFGGKHDALKGRKSGETVTIEGVSPAEHYLTVKLSSRNLADVSKWSANKCVINNDGTVTCNIIGSNYAEIYTTKLNDLLLAHKGETITFSIAETFQNRHISLVINGKRADGTNLTVAPYKINSNFVSAVISEEFASIGEIRLRFNWKSSDVQTDKTSVVSNILLAFGEEAEYTPYIADFSGVKLITSENGRDYKSKADGMVKCVRSVYPRTTLTTDTQGVLIDCEYNRDINKAFEELQKAILALGGTDNVS